MEKQLKALNEINEAIAAELKKNEAAKGPAMPHLQDAQVRGRIMASQLSRHIASGAKVPDEKKPEPAASSKEGSKAAAN